ncbi:hypothetical protein CY34DRAFT_436572 [Suillus luteus UH-Slu-Lm8-n1]|uniref:Uncharacterized protein n=1 Tax=Suillus luteus UH-Slu-Lm8-n1 TaxID=930992 RepID=A0A0D0BUC1_9AGAM|nr:hypothetical protein CY34DRAFT_436572 [Suillus luteus UH-Slu-Lm8-n1]
MTPALTRSTENMVSARRNLEDVWVRALSGCLQSGEAGPNELSVCLTELQDIDHALMTMYSANI